MSVGENIRKRRTALGITQMKLAEAAMVSHPMIVAYERGTKNPSLQVAFEISKALECTLEDLLDPPEREEGNVDGRASDVLKDSGAKCKIS